PWSYLWLLVPGRAASPPGEAPLSLSPVVELWRSPPYAADPSLVSRSQEGGGPLSVGAEARGPRRIAVLPRCGPLGQASPLRRLIGLSVQHGRGVRSGDRTPEFSNRPRSRRPNPALQQPAAHSVQPGSKRLAARPVAELWRSAFL